MAKWLHSAERLAAHRAGPHALFGIAFADSSFFPVPPDLLLVPMALLHPRQLWRLTLIAIVGSSLGAMLGYAIGWGLWDTIGRSVVEHYGYAEHFADYRETFAEYGVWIIILKALTPIPFKLVAIAAGLAEMNVWTFMLAVVAGRALHFVMLAGLIRWLGVRGMELIRRYERRAAAIAAIALVGLIAGFAMIEAKRIGNHHHVAATGAAQAAP